MLAKYFLPNFLGIGAQKSGTTWLYQMLRHHPDLFFSTPKEIHFFDQHFQKGFLWYSRHFYQATNKVKGEITPAYAILPGGVINVIKKRMPKVRLVYLLRNPIERAWSHALMYFMRRQEKTFDQISEKEFFNHFTSSSSILRGDYIYCLHNWLNVFSKEQLYIAYYEDIINRPQELIKDVFQHIGVNAEIDFSKLPMKKKIFSNTKIEMPEKYYDFLHTLYAPKIEVLNSRLQNQIIQSWL